MKDRYECLQDAELPASGAYVSQIVPSCDVWKACMGGRGYVVDPHGDLAPPPGNEVKCHG